MHTGVEWRLFSSLRASAFWTDFHTQTAKLRMGWYAWMHTGVQWRLFRSLRASAFWTDFHTQTAKLKMGW